MAMLPRNPSDDFPSKRKRPSETMILDFLALLIALIKAFN